MSTAKDDLKALTSEVLGRQLRDLRSMRFAQDTLTKALPHISGKKEGYAKDILATLEEKIEQEKKDIAFRKKTHQKIFGEELIIPEDKIPPMKDPNNPFLNYFGLEHMAEFTMEASAQPHLEIVFHDNDFGWPVSKAVKTLWSFIHENNGHLLRGGKYPSRPDAPSIEEVFKELHKAGALRTLLTRLYVLADQESHVEFLTRGLHREAVNWAEKVLEKPGELHIEETYINFKFRFHEGDDFMWEWKNSEHCALNLVTGAVRVF